MSNQSAHQPASKNFTLEMNQKRPHFLACSQLQSIVTTAGAGIFMGNPGTDQDVARKRRVCLKFMAVCENYHTILSRGTKCSSAKRKIEKLLNSNIHLSHWLEDAFTGCFLKPEYTMKVINDVSLLFLKGIILQRWCCYQWLLLIMLLTLSMYLTNLYTAFSLAILPPYPLLLLFLAPFCLSTTSVSFSLVIAQLN